MNFMLNELPLIGEIIKNCRLRQGYTQNELAEEIGLTFRQLSSIENDKSYPKFETLVALVQLLNIPTAQLFGIERGEDKEAEQFYELLLSCDEDDRKTVIETASMLIRRLKEAKGK